MKKYCIIIHSLKYEPDPDKFLQVTPEQLARMRNRKKLNPYRNDYIKRYTPKKFEELQDQEIRRQFREEYDKKIMAKYNVGKDYEQDRWFMEQVRPTL